MLRTSIVALVLVGCGKPPVEAPEGLNDLARFLTTNFEAEGTEELEAGMLGLDAELTALDLEGDVDGRAFTMAPLRPEDLGGMPQHAGYDVEAQIPVAVATRSQHDFASQMRIVQETNHVCIESGTTKFYGRTFDTDVACFVDGSCPTVKTSNEVRKESLLGNIWYDLPKEYRRFTLEDGRNVMVSRGFSPDVYNTDGGGGSFDQTYILEAWIEDGTKTKRFYSMWSSVTLSAVGDDAWAALVRSGIDEGYGYADDYLADFAEELCREDRDRAYDRE
ncbi:MAG: hypothetical protein R3F61_00880 [Myxococcota bacterium]